MGVGGGISFGPPRLVRGGHAVDEAAHRGHLRDAFGRAAMRHIDFAIPVQERGRLAEVVQFVDMFQ